MVPGDMYQWSWGIFAKKSKLHDAGGPDTVVSPYFNMLVSGGGELHIAESKQKIHIYNFCFLLNAPDKLLDLSSGNCFQEMCLFLANFLFGPRHYLLTVHLYSPL